MVNLTDLGASVSEDSPRQTEDISAGSSSGLLTHLTKKRQYARQRVSTNYNKIFAIPCDIKIEQVYMHIDKLTKLREELNSYNEQIIMCIDESEIEERSALDETYDSKIIDCISKLNSMMSFTHPIPVASGNPVPQNSLKLPQI